MRRCEMKYQSDARDPMRPDFYAFLMHEQQEIRLLLRQMSIRMEKMELGIRKGLIAVSSSDDDDSHFVADNIDSIMGLKEALTSRNTFLRVVWTILVALGVAATGYYLYRNTQEYLNKEVATKSSLTKSVAYDYPPLIVCPPWPFDTDSLESKGLNVDSLTYSLGYSMLHERYSIMERIQRDFSIVSWAMRGKDRFLDYYKKSHYHSMVEYLKSVLVDIDQTATDVNKTTVFIGSSDNTMVLGNISSPKNKTIYSNGMCYQLQLRKASMRTTQNPSSLILTNFDHSRGVLDSKKKAWVVDFLPNILPEGPTTALEPSYKYTIKLSAQRIIMLKNGSNCVDADSSSAANPQRCPQDCIERTLSSVGLGGQYMSIDSRPSDLSNAFDFYTRLMARVNESIQSGQFDPKKFESEQDVLNIAGVNTSAAEILLDPDGGQLQKCFETCLPACDRTIYDMTVSRDGAIPREESNGADPAGPPGESIVHMSIKHSAIFQGGIVTLQEVTTVTFSDFVSNIGGTLGLFLGCTVMTFAQIVMAILSHTIRKR